MSDKIVIEDPTDKDTMIVRTVVQFLKHKDNYIISLFIKGHKFDFSNHVWGCISDRIILCEIPEEKLEEMVKYYSDQGHDYEIKENQ